VVQFKDVETNRFVAVAVDGEAKEYGAGRSRYWRSVSEPHCWGVAALVVGTQRDGGQESKYSAIRQAKVSGSGCRMDAQQRAKAEPR
jgi:hypothetical protein